FEVELTNTDAVPVNIGAFTFGVEVANPKISFTDANTSTTNPYIFGSNSLAGPDLTGPVSGQSLITSDLFATPMMGADVSAGATVGLANILFDVSSSAAPGIFPVTLIAFPATSLSGPDGTDIGIDTLSPGAITITGLMPVPEPASATMLAVISLLLCAV